MHSVFRQKISALHKFKIMLSYYLLSRNKIIKILKWKLKYDSQQKAHVLSILKEIWIENSYEFTESTHKILSKSAGVVIVDIGANIGISTLYFRSKYPKTEIICIEASPINYDTLLKNIELNNVKNITPLNLFISNNSNTHKFFHDIEKSGSSFGYGYKDRTKKNLKEFEVKSESLSKLLVSYQSLVIKMDVEGAEYEILKDICLSPILPKIIEIVAEVSTRDSAQYKNLISIFEIYLNEGFNIQIKSDCADNRSIGNTKQNHLLISLTREHS